MQKKNFISLVLGTIGTILFGIGMCMCLLVEWNLLKPGIVMGIVGFVVLLLMWMVRRKMEGKPAIQWNIKTVGITLFTVFATLIFGVGMTMTMVLEGLMLQGIILGVFGMFLLLMLIPMCKGLH